VGSANLDGGSLERNTELNATWWDAGVAGELRRDLFAEHLGDDVATDDARPVLGRFREVALANGQHVARRQPLCGLAVVIDPARYGE